MWRLEREASSRQQIEQPIRKPDYLWLFLAAAALAGLWTPFTRMDQFIGEILGKGLLTMIIPTWVLRLSGRAAAYRWLMIISGVLVFGYWYGRWRP